MRINVDNYTRLEWDSNIHVIYICKSGWGKSLKIEGVADMLNGGFADNPPNEWRMNHLKRPPYVVIFMVDVKDTIEPGFAMFDPIARYHLNELFMQGSKPSKKNVKLYHPFSFNLPKHKLPDMTLFTLPISNRSKEEFAMLAETESETDSVRLLMNVADNLSPNEGLMEMLQKVQIKIKKEKRSKHGEDFVVPDKVTLLESTTRGTMKDVGELASYFIPFFNHYLLTPKNFFLNLDVDSIVNDPYHYHMLITKWLGKKDEKMKDFVKIAFYKELMRNPDKFKYPILFVWEEIRRLTPYKPEGYKKYLGNALRNELSVVRNIGKGISFIMGSQVWWDVDEKVRESATETFFGNLGGLSDLERVSKAMKYRRDIVEDLNTMEKGCFLRKGYEEFGAWKFMYPTHMHAEEGYNFLNMYAKYYPEKLKSYSDIVLKVKEYEENVRKTVGLKLNEDYKRKQQSIKEKQEYKEKGSATAKKLDEMKDKHKKEKVKKKSEVKEMIKKIVEAEPGLSKRKIGERLGIHHSTISTYMNQIRNENQPKIETEDDFDGNGDEDGLLDGLGKGKP